MIKCVILPYSHSARVTYETNEEKESLIKALTPVCDILNTGGYNR